MADLKFTRDVYEEAYLRMEPGGRETWPYSDNTIMYLNLRLYLESPEKLIPEEAAKEAEDEFAYEEELRQDVAPSADPSTEEGKATLAAIELMRKEAREERESWADRLGRNITDFIWQKMFGWTEENIDKGFQRWVDMGLLDENGVEVLKGYINDNEKAGPLVYLGIYLLLGKTWLTANMDSIGGDYAKKIRAQWSPASPANAEVLRAAFVDPDHTTAVRKVMRENGLSEEDIDLIFLANYALYDPATVRSLFFRGELSERQVYMRLNEMGYTNTRVQEMIKTWDIIPPIADIITMYAKEAFEPEIIQKIGLGDEFPREGVEWAQKHGLSEDWLKKYWYAHWDQPSIQMGFQMLHRGVIDWETLDMLFRIVEIPPFWRDKLNQIAYTPYTRVDVRRMHLLGVISDEELKQAYQDLGYDDTKSDKMVDWTILYNRGSEKDLTRSQIEAAYRKRAIIEVDARMMLVDLGYSRDEAAFMTDLIDFDEDQKHEDALIENIKTAYLLRIVNRVDTVNNLNGLALPAKRIDFLMETWDLHMVETKKLPSKTDLDKFYRKDLITQDEYKEDMRNLGYSERHIDLYAALIELGKGEE